MRKKKIRKPFAVFTGIILFTLAACGSTASTVIWQNYNGDILQKDVDVEKGTNPEYRGAVPSKEGNEQYNYTFTGWDKSTANDVTTYTATFKENLNEFTVNWFNYDHSLLLSEKYEYGKTPKYPGIEPEKDKKDKFSYRFIGWSPEIVPVVSNQNYIAQYKQELSKYRVTWYNYDYTELATSDVYYNDVPTYNGETPTRERDLQYEYEFKGWSPKVDHVTEDTIYVAEYDQIPLTHNINFDFNGGTSKSESHIAVYLLDASDFPLDVKKEGYNFRGWSYLGELVINQNGEFLTTLETVDNMTFTAVFSETSQLKINKKIINTDKELMPGETSGEGDYRYHQVVTVKAKANDGFTFIGWYSVGESNLDEVLISSEETFVFQMWEKDTRIEARFQVNSYDMEIKSNNSTLGKVMFGDTSYEASASKKVKYSDSVTVSALTNNGEVTFLGWYDGETLVSTNDVYTFIMPKSDYSLRAVWDLFDAKFVYKDGYANAKYYVYGDEYKTFEVTSSTALQLPETPTSDAGDIFAGWRTSNGVYYDFSTPLNGDINFYAAFIDPVYYANGIYGTTDYDYSSSERISREVVAQVSKTDYFNFVTPYTGEYTFYYANDNSGLYYSTEINLYRGTELINEEVLVNDSTNFKSYQFTSNAGDIIRVNLEMNHSDYTTTNKFCFTTPTVTGVTLGNTENIHFGEKVNNSANFHRQGYLLAGWEDEDGTLYVNYEGQGIQGWDEHDDKELYPRWDLVIYTLNYDFNGGQGRATDTFDVEHARTINQVPTRDGYDFVGWYLDEELIEKATNTEGHYEDFTVYAKWEPKQYNITYKNIPSYKITYDHNYDDSTDNVVEEKYYSPSGTYSYHVPSRDGYVFNGWYLEKECTTSFDINTTIEGDMTLYAKWVKMADPSNSNTIISNAHNYNSEENPYSYNVISSTSSEPDYLYMRANESGEHYLYYYNQESSSEYRYYMSIYNLTKGSTIASGYSVTNTDPNSVKFNCNEGDIIAISLYPEDPNLDVTAKLYFDGFNTLPNLSLLDITKGKVTFGEEFELFKPVRNGYTFEGWLDSNNEPFSEVDEEGNPKLWDIPNDISLTATWKIVDFEIAYHLDGGTLENPSATFNANNVVKLSELVPEKGGYDFDGWYLDEDYTNPIKSTKDVYENIDVYAKWNAKTFKATINDLSGKVSINYDLNYIDDATSEEVIETVAYNRNYSPTILVPTRTGYVFENWYLDKDCTELFDSSKKINGDITIYAKWATMATSYYSRNYIDNPEVYDAENTNTISVNASSSSSPSYIYLRANEAGTHKVYYSNSSTSYIYRYYLTIKNLTSGTTILNATTVTNTTFTNTSFECNKGDVIEISYYYYYTTATGYLYFEGFGASENLLFLQSGDIVEMKYGEAYELPIPSKDGYEFKYWEIVDKASKHTKIDTSGTWSIEEDVELYPYYQQL